MAERAASDADLLVGWFRAVAPNDADDAALLFAPASSGNDAGADEAAEAATAALGRLRTSCHPQDTALSFTGRLVRAMLRRATLAETKNCGWVNGCIAYPTMKETVDAIGADMKSRRAIIINDQEVGKTAADELDRQAGREARAGAPRLYARSTSSSRSTDYDQQLRSWLLQDCAAFAGSTSGFRTHALRDAQGRTLGRAQVAERIVLFGDAETAFRLVNFHLPQVDGNHAAGAVTQVEYLVALLRYVVEECLARRVPCLATGDANQTAYSTVATHATRAALGAVVGDIKRAMTVPPADATGLYRSGLHERPAADRCRFLLTVLRELATETNEAVDVTTFGRKHGAAIDHVMWFGP